MCRYKEEIYHLMLWPLQVKNEDFSDKTPTKDFEYWCEEKYGAVQASNCRWTPKNSSIFNLALHLSSEP